MEALEHQDSFSAVFRKYQGLLSLPKNCIYACICSFVEESYLKSFICDVRKLLEDSKVPLQFSILYVKKHCHPYIPGLYPGNPGTDGKCHNQSPVSRPVRHL
uniref:hypothetical protein n=1 Tax=Clostridium sp. NkU-1 TaxID=1095009 RepID=UPI0032600CDA